MTQKKVKQNQLETLSITASQVSDFSTAADARITAATGVSVQAYDADLTTIASLTPTTTNMIQSVAGAWASQTPAQVKTALALNNVPNSSATFIGTTSVALNRTSANLTLTGITLTSPAINTPTGIVKGDVGLGNVDNTSNATERAATASLTNKDITSATNIFASITTTTSSATPAPTGSSYFNELYLTAQTAGMTFAAPSGTPVNGNELYIRVKTAAAQTTAFNAIYLASGVAPLMTTTVAGKTHMMKFKYDSTATKWVQQAVDAVGY